MSHCVPKIWIWDGFPGNFRCVSLQRFQSEALIQEAAASLFLLGSNPFPEEAGPELGELRGSRNLDLEAFPNNSFAIPASVRVLMSRASGSGLFNGLSVGFVREKLIPDNYPREVFSAGGHDLISILLPFPSL